MQNIVYKKCKAPERETIFKQVDLSNETMNYRLNNVRQKMKDRGLDAYVVYADREHGSNFEYLTGFIPRFEEALLVITADNNCLVLGNENLKMASHARLKCNLVHAPYFSLPDQPMENVKPFIELLKDAGLSDGMKIATAGWKVFTSSFEDNRNLFELPYMIVDCLKQIAGPTGFVENHSDLLMKDVRCVNNANEIAHYAYGAALSSDAILAVYKNIDLDKNDLLMASLLEKDGQPNTVTTIYATGERYTNANLYPKDKFPKLGDKISFTTGYKGGLSSRAAYVAYSENDLNENNRDYLDKVVKPYFNLYTEWLENIRTGMKGKELYSLCETILPKDTYHWSLNPGHLIQDEEWLSSPVYKNSEEEFKSGMMFQIDIIPSVKGYGGTGAEECICLADESLRDDLKQNYPDLWNNILRRREYIINQLGINISEEVLPLSNAVGYLNPFVLNKGYCMVKE